MPSYEVEVTIVNGGGECPRFEVAWHIFGQMPVGDAHNALVMEKRQFIEDAIREKLLRERHAQRKGGGDAV